MLDRRPGLIIVRGFFGAAVCLMLLIACVACGPGTLTPLAPVPTGVAATGGNAVVTLTWAASSGAKSYNVKRSTTNGGPYTQLASPTTTGYTDSTATNGTKYFYVVSAVNAGGESANSNEVSVIPAGPPATGTWINVTPAAVNLVICAGTHSVQADPMHPSNLYAEFDCNGVWKSTDYGL